MSETNSTRLDGLLDWLAGEVAARLRASASPAAPPEPDQKETEAPPAPPLEPDAVTVEAPGSPAAAIDEGLAPAAPAEEAPPELQPADAVLDPAPLPSHAAQLMGRLAIGLLLAVLLINIPLSRSGIALARMIPSSNPLIVRDGLLVKEDGNPDVYVYRAGQFHWITDLGVFERYGYQWQSVQTVAPGFLAGYEIGRPLYLLAKCPTSPHVYRLENGVRRWIVDIATFEAEGYQWAEVQTMDCYTLRAMPEGETIPPGRGPAPQP